MIKKQTISVAFSKIESFEDIKDASTEEKALDAQECFYLKSAKGHQSHWTDVYANFSALESLEGFKEGLKILHVNGCANLKTAVGLPASCEELHLDGSDVRSLYIINDLYRTVNMTDGIKTLSVRGCKNLFTLRGISPTCQTVFADESAITSFKDLPNGVERISAKACKNIKSTKGLPQSCKYLDLSFSSVETLEDIPETIEEIRLYNCYSLKKEELTCLPTCVTSKIKGLSANTEGNLQTITHNKQKNPNEQNNQKTR